MYLSMPMETAAKVHATVPPKHVANTSSGDKTMPAVPVFQQKPNEQEEAPLQKMSAPANAPNARFVAPPAITPQPADGKPTTPFTIQKAAATPPDGRTRFNPIQKNNTGMPDNLKSGIENLSGFSMDDTQVHYNSAQPAQLNAHAYAQGSDIYIAPGQEKHLPHEAWHVVQQKQGRVQSTLQAKGVGINDDRALENEADHMGAAAMNVTQCVAKKTHAPTYSYPVVQRVGDKMALGYEAGLSGDLLALQNGIQEIYARQKFVKKVTRNKLDKDYQDQTVHLDERQSYLTAAIESETITEVLKSPLAAAGKITQDTLTAHRGVANGVKAGLVILSPQETAPLDVLASTQAVKNAVPILEKLAGKDQKKNPENKAGGIVDRTIELAKDYGRHLISDPIVHAYEQGYKDSAMTQVNLMRDIDAFIDGRNFKSLKTTSKSMVEISVTLKTDADYNFIDIATLYLNEKRFVKTGEIAIKNEVQKREIFKHRGNNKEYVQDAFGRHVKRYVKRALNDYDNPNALGTIAINSDPRKKKTGGKELWKDIAAALPAKPQDKITTEISKHQREKEKQGGSPFISLTTTDRPIFGSSAKNFEGNHGVATIDLAQIPKRRVFDTHTAEAIKHIHNVDDPNPGMAFVPGNDTVARNSAARDSMRTRELVVSGDIPDEALTGFGKKGVAHTKTGAKKFAPPAPRGPVIEDVD